jgi:hypothetical protein
LKRANNTKYYDGPGGIFYDAVNDSIFVLERQCGYIGNRRTHERLGGMYDAWYSRAKKPTYRNTAIAPLPEGEVIRLADLPEGW